MKKDRRKILLILCEAFDRNYLKEISRMPLHFTNTALSETKALRKLKIITTKKRFLCATTEWRGTRTSLGDLDGARGEGIEWLMSVVIRPIVSVLRNCLNKYCIRHLLLQILQPVAMLGFTTNSKKRTPEISIIILEIIFSESNKTFTTLFNL